MTIEAFAKQCKCGAFINYDGVGYLATETEESDITVYPSEATCLDKQVMKLLGLGQLTHVVWYNK
jgi:hypothetical protein